MPSKPVDRAATADALKSAAAILALEGMVGDAEIAEMNQRVLAGEITLDEARRHFVNQARQGLPAEFEADGAPAI